VKKVTSGFGTLVLANILEDGRATLLNTKKSEFIGYDLAIFYVSSVYVIGKAVTGLMRIVKSEGMTISVINKMILFEEFNNLIELPEIRQIEKQYVTDRAKKLLDITSPSKIKPP